MSGTVTRLIKTRKLDAVATVPSEFPTFEDMNNDDSSADEDAADEDGAATSTASMELDKKL